MDVSAGRWRAVRSIFAAFVASLVLTANGFAAALVQDVKGDVRAAEAAVAKGQRVLTGATLITGPSSQATLAFDDGQQVVLNENTRFAITDYRFVKANPQSDRSFFNLLSGAARVVTGELAQRSRNAFEFRTPTSTIGIRGTDFIVAIVEQPSYLSVLQGEIAATNAAGTVAFGAGSFGMISTATALAVAIPAIALPAAAASAFSSLGAAAVGAGAAAAGGVAGSAAGAAGIGTIAAVGGGVAAIGAAASSSNSSSGSSSTTTSGSSAFAGPYHGTYTSSVSGTSSGVAVTGSCTGSWSGTTDTSGVFSGTLTVSSCTSGGSTTRAAGSYPISSQISAGGVVAQVPYTQTASGITVSCDAGSGTVTATTANYTDSCTVTGTLTPCTGNCSVNITGTETYTGTRP